MLNLVVWMHQNLIEHLPHIASQCYFVPSPCCQYIEETIDEVRTFLEMVFKGQAIVTFWRKDKSNFFVLSGVNLCKILLHKLDQYGFRGHINIWLSSYLQGRRRTTQIGPHISKRLDSTCGVPQGSVLGPLLFCDISVIYRKHQISLDFTFLWMIQMSFCW